MHALEFLVKDGVAAAVVRVAGASV